MIVFPEMHMIKVIIFVVLSSFLGYATYFLTKTQNAYANGICIKAHPYRSFFRSTSYTTSVRYKYGGRFYNGDVISSNQLFKQEQDSCSIKIDPNNPQYLSYSDECK